MISTDKRQADALERIATALEFFQGIHPEYRAVPGEAPLPSSKAARAFEDARLKLEHEASVAQLKAAVDAANGVLVVADKEQVEAEAALKHAEETSEAADKALAVSEMAHAPAAEIVKLKEDATAASAAVVEAENQLTIKSAASHDAKMKVDHAVRVLAAKNKNPLAEPLAPGPVVVSPKPVTPPLGSPPTEDHPHA